MKIIIIFSVVLLASFQAFSECRLYPNNRIERFNNQTRSVGIFSPTDWKKNPVATATTKQPPFKNLNIKTDVGSINHYARLSIGEAAILESRYITANPLEYVTIQGKFRLSNFTGFSLSVYWEVGPDHSIFIPDQNGYTPNPAFRISNIQLPAYHYFSVPLDKVNEWVPFLHTFRMPAEAANFRLIIQGNSNESENRNEYAQPIVDLDDLSLQVSSTLNECIPSTALSNRFESYPPAGVSSDLAMNEKGFYTQPDLPNLMVGLFISTGDYTRLPTEPNYLIDFKNRGVDFILGSNAADVLAVARARLYQFPTMASASASPQSLDPQCRLNVLSTIYSGLTDGGKSALYRICKIEGTVSNSFLGNQVDFEHIMNSILGYMFDQDSVAAESQRYKEAIDQLNGFCQIPGAPHTNIQVCNSLLKRPILHYTVSHGINKSLDDLTHINNIYSNEGFWGPHSPITQKAMDIRNPLSICHILLNDNISLPLTLDRLRSRMIGCVWAQSPYMALFSDRGVQKLASEPANSDNVSIYDAIYTGWWGNSCANYSATNPCVGQTESKLPELKKDMQWLWNNLLGRENSDFTLTTVSPVNATQVITSKRRLGNGLIEQIGNLLSGETGRRFAIWNPTPNVISGSYCLDGLTGSQRLRQINKSINPIKVPFRRLNSCEYVFDYSVAPYSVNLYSINRSSIF